MQIDGNDLPASRNEPLKKKLPEAVAIDNGKYVHFGVENALNGSSVGLILRDADLIQFFDIYQKDPKLFPAHLRGNVKSNRNRRFAQLFSITLATQLLNGST
jgi:hypothetical protein